MKTRYIIPDVADLSRCCELDQQYHLGFEYNDFCMSSILDDEQKVKELLQTYQSLSRDRSQDTLHGAFLDVTVDSTDAQIRKISHMRIRQSLEIAKQLGVKGVVFHTNYIANFRLQTYQEHWLNGVEGFYKEILNEYPMLEIYIENMFDMDPVLLCQLAKRFENETRFGVCLDIAHAFLSEVDLEEWFVTLGKYVKHMHLNDNFGYEDQHLAVGSGRIPWSEVDKWIQKYTSNASVLVEVKGVERAKASIEYLKNHDISLWNERKVK